MLWWAVLLASGTPWLAPAQELYRVTWGSSIREAPSSLVASHYWWIDGNYHIKQNEGQIGLMADDPMGNRWVYQWRVNGALVNSYSDLYVVSGISTATHVEVVYRDTVSVTPYSDMVEKVSCAYDLDDYSHQSSSSSWEVWKGENVTFTAHPPAGYVVDYWLFNNADAQQGGSTFTIAMTSPYNHIGVFFKVAPREFTITASAGPGGSLSPSGSVTVQQGGSQTFTASANAGYTVDVWRVDGVVAQTGGASYTLSNVQTNRAVQLTFKVQAATYTVNARAGTGGSIHPGGTLQITEGGSQTFTATPNSGYVVDRWEVDLIPVQTGGATYTLANVTGNRTVEVLFRLGTTTNSHTVTAAAGNGGAISPSGTLTVPHGGSQTFTATADSGYQIDAWRVDGAVVQNGGATYTLNNVTADQAVQVTFWMPPVTHTVFASAGSNGSISPSGSVTVTHGASRTFTASPDSGYTVDVWRVDGAVVQTGGATCTLNNVTTDHTVQASFRALPSYTLTVTVGAGGMVVPTGVVVVIQGAGQSFAATPDGGSAVETWWLDGVATQAGGTSFNLAHVTGNHTVHVTFWTPPVYTISASAGAGGVIAPTGVAVVAHGESRTFTATPDTGFAVDVWTLDGVIAQSGGAAFTVSSVLTNHTLRVTFSRRASLTPANNFRVAWTPTVGPNPVWMLAGDYDNDGRAELAVAIYADNQIRLMTNDGQGTFGTRAILAAASVGHLAETDVNGDGSPDLVAISSCVTCKTATVFTNNGSGQFVASAVLATQGRPTRSQAITNLLGDGKVGLAITLYDVSPSAVELWTNAGQGRFVFHKQLSGGNRPVSGMAAADFNNDGRQDLVYVNRADAGGPTAMIWTNGGAGRFNIASSPALPSHGWAVMAGDVNGDAKSDFIAATANNNSTAVFTNASGGVLVHSQTIEVQNYPQHVAPVPGRFGLDFVAANTSGNSLSIVTNNGAGRFGVSTNIPVGAGPACVAAADLNQDGVVDLVAANNGASTLSVLLGQTDVAPTVESLPGAWFSVAAAALAGAVSPNGVAAHAWFEWGDTPGYGHRSEPVPVNFASGTILLTNEITGLAGHLPLHFRLCASNAMGRLICGADVAMPPSLPVIVVQPADQIAGTGDATAFSVTASGQPPLVFQWRFNDDVVDGANGPLLLLSNVSPERAGVYSVVVSTPFGSVTSAPASLTVTQVFTLAAALDAPGWRWTTSGEPLGWAPQTNVTYDGQDAARSGALTDGQQSVLQTSITGPGTLSFWWKVSSEEGYDKLSFNGGGAKRSISGETGWQQVSIHLPAGPQALSWTYLKDESSTQGEDAAWVDQVVFAPPPVRLTAGWAAVSAFRLAVSGASGQNCVIEATPDLRLPWQRLTNFALTNSVLTFEDLSVSNAPQRFYRARLEP